MKILSDAIQSLLMQHLYKVSRKVLVVASFFVVSANSALAVSEPHEQIMQGITALRQNDVKSLVESYVPSAELEKMRAQWEKQRQEEIPEADKAEFEQTIGMLLMPNAEDTLMMMVEPQLEAVKGQWTAMVPMFEGFAMMGVQEAEGLDESMKGQAVKAIQAVSKWAQENDLTSPALARQALTQVVATTKAIGVTTLDDLAALDLDEIMQRGSIALAGVKEVMSVYGIQLDEMLDSIKAETLSVDGENAKVKVGMNFFGEYIEAESDMLLVDGLWVDKKAQESLASLTANTEQSSSDSSAQSDLESATAANETKVIGTTMPSPVSVKPAAPDVNTVEKSIDERLNAAQTYLAYKQALSNASDLSDVEPYLSNRLAESAKLSELATAPQSVQIIGESIDDSKIVLRVVGAGNTDLPSQTVVLLKIEDGKWRIDQIRWSDMPLETATAERPAEVLEAMARTDMASDVLPDTTTIKPAVPEVTTTTQPGLDTQAMAIKQDSQGETESQQQPIAAVVEKPVVPEAVVEPVAAEKSEALTIESLQAQFDRNPFFKRFNIKLTAQDLMDGFLTAELTDASPSLLKQVRDGFDLADGNVATLSNAKDRPAALAVQKVIKSVQVKHSLGAVLLLPPPEEQSAQAEDPVVDQAVATVEIVAEPQVKAGTKSVTTAATESATLVTEDVAVEPQLQNETEQDEAKQADEEATQAALAKQQADDERKTKRRERIRQIQVRLAELGYSPGTPDGLAGRGTRGAIREYQENADLAADGEPTVAVLAHMNSADAVEYFDEEVILIDPEDDSEIVELVDPDETETVEEEKTGGKVKGFFGKLFKKKGE